VAKEPEKRLKIAEELADVVIYALEFANSTGLDVAASIEAIRKELSKLQHPEVQNFRRWMLLTRDAHRLYRKFGFESPAHPERVMEISKPGLYTRWKMED